MYNWPWFRIYKAIWKSLSFVSVHTRHLFKYASGTETRSSGQQFLCTAWEVQKLLLGPMWGSEFASETFTELQIAQYLK